jgi:outer membrane protein TolC
MKRHRAIFSLLVLGLTTASAYAAETPAAMKLSLEEALKKAGENNYSVRAAKARIDQAQARYVQTRKAYLPSVTISEQFIHTNDPGAALVFKLQQGIVTQNDFYPPSLNNPDTINDFETSIQVMQPLINVDAMIARDAARTAKEAQEFMTERTGETISFYVKKAYYGLILARKNLDAVNQSITTMQGYGRESGKAYEAGIMSKSDKLSTEVRLAELKEQKLMMQDAIRNASDALKLLMNLNSEVVIIPTGDLKVDKSLPVVSENAAVSAERSDLKALHAYHEAAGLQHDIARAQWLPRLNAFVQKSWHDSDIFGTDGSNWTLGVNMQWKVFDGMADFGRAQEAKAQQLEAQYAYEEARDQSRNDIRKAMRTLKTAKERIAVAQKSLEEAKVSFDYIGQQYRTGMAMTFELLMREGAYTYAKMRLNQAKYDYMLAKSELDYYSGR